MKHFFSNQDLYKILNFSFKTIHKKLTPFLSNSAHNVFLYNTN